MTLLDLIRQYKAIKIEDEIIPINKIRSVEIDGMEIAIYYDYKLEEKVKTTGTYKVELIKKEE